MSLQAIPPRPPLSPRSVLRVIHDRNPFYLLSALSMFIGYRLVIAALDTAPGEWRPLLSLIVTMNLYELVMIGLALYLIRRRGLLREGWILLGIEALFLADLTNLNAELATALPRLGTAVSAACFGLALLKIGVVVRTLGLRLTPGTIAYGVAQLAALFALPAVFRLLRSDDAASVSPGRIYAAWWVVGALAAIGAAVARRDPRTVGSPMAALPGRLYLMVPLVSLLVHLASENRVYWVHFQPANVAPVLLAAVVLLNRRRWHPMQLQWSVGLIALAVAASLVPDEDASALTGHLLGVEVTPLRLVLPIAAVVTAAVAWLHGSWGLAAALALAVATPIAVAAGRRLVRLAEWAWAELLRLVPETPLEWGYAAIGGAFLLLGVGAVFSLRSSPRAQSVIPPLGPTPT
jgi:hypothetical protein